MNPFNDAVPDVFMCVCQICVLWEHGDKQPLFGVDDLEAFNFHEKTTLSHVNGIFIDDILDVYIGAYSHDQLEDSIFVASYFSGKICDFVVARHILVELASFVGDHCCGGY